MIDLKRKLFHRIAIVFLVLVYLTGAGDFSSSDEMDDDLYNIPPAKLRKLYETKAVIIKEDGTITWLPGQKELLKK